MTCIIYYLTIRDYISDTSEVMSRVQNNVYCQLTWMGNNPIDEYSTMFWISKFEVMYIRIVNCLPHTGCHSCLAFDDS